MNVCVFCSASEVDEKYVHDAERLAKLLGEAGHALVWGASDRGLMRVMGEGVRRAGGKLIGISVDFLKEQARKDTDELVIMKTLGERRAAMLERGDVLIVLPGGLGTLDETTEVLELKKHWHHNKPVIVLNTDGFYDGFKMQLERIGAEGFLASTERPRPLEEFATFVDTPEEAVALLNHGN